MQPADLIIKARWLISMDHHDQVHENRAVVIREGKIIAIELANRVDSLYEATETCHLPHHALMPGFVNAHTHLPMSLLRGLADDLPLMKWLEEYIWPTERHWVAEDFVRDGARLAMAELIRGGVTCFNEMYFFENQIAEVAHEVGLRGRVAESILDFEMPWSKNGDVCIQKVIDNIQFVKDFPLIEPSVAPHSPYGTSRKHLERALEIVEIAAKTGVHALKIQTY
ncbi:MAG: TRZ/ATZ family hydrolase, partial [Gammaproteobacteria bacterium]|nr:TRZ/ATZ family hydrolase [Gammaproteobacteria bacterium]